MPSNSLNLASRAKNRKYCSLHNELKPFLQEHSYSFPAYVKYIFINTVFPQIRPADIIILDTLQMRVLLENTTFLLNKIVRIAGIIWGRALYEEIGYSFEKAWPKVHKKVHENFLELWTVHGLLTLLIHP